MDDGKRPQNNLVKTKRHRTAINMELARVFLHQNRKHNISTSCLHSKAIISPTIPSVPFCKENEKPHMNKI